MKQKKTLSKTLPSIRIEEKDIENMKAAIKKFNKNAIVKMNEQGFRRYAIKTLSKMLLLNKKFDLEL